MTMQITRDELRKRVSSWDEVQHEPVSTPPTGWENLTDEAACELIVHWFFSNFEDPVENTPYNGREGGYQYIWGGPYDASDIIENVFYDLASEEAIEQSINEIQENQFDWAPSSSRRLPPDDDERYGTDTSLSSVHQELSSELENAKKLLGEISKARPVGLGHNNPPEEIYDVLDASDIESLEKDIDTLIAQPEAPKDKQVPLQAVQNITLFLQRAAAKAGKYLDIFLTEAAKSAGGKAGTALIGAGIYVNLDKIVQLANTWLAALGTHF